MAWTKVAKPTNQTWTRTTFTGARIYDDAAITYDSAITLYDSINNAAWTSVAKPTSSVWTKVAKPST